MPIYDKLSLSTAADYINYPQQPQNKPSEDLKALAIIKILQHIESPGAKKLDPVVKEKVELAAKKLQDLENLSPSDKKVVLAFQSLKEVPADRDAKLKQLSKEFKLDLKNLVHVCKTKYPGYEEKIYQLIATEDVVELRKIERALCRSGDFNLHKKSRIEITASAFRRVGTSAVNLLVTLPLGVARVASAPVIALAGVVWLFVADKETKKDLLKIAASEFSQGTVQALSSVIDFTGSLIGSTIDSISGKEYARTATLYLMAGARQITRVTVSILWPAQEPAKTPYHDTIQMISSFSRPKKNMSELKVSKWNPSANALKAANFGNLMASKSRVDKMREKRIESRKIATKAIKPPITDTMQKALKIPDELMTNFCDYAKWLDAEKRYDDAEAVYFVLALLSPDRPAVWASLGHAREMLDQHGSAFEAYAQAFSINPTDKTLIENCKKCIEAMPDEQQAEFRTKLEELTQGAQ